MIRFTVLDRFSPPPECDMSMKVILVKAPPKETCPRNYYEILEKKGGINQSRTVNRFGGGQRGGYSESIDV